MTKITIEEVSEAIERCMASEPADGLHLPSRCKPLVDLLGTMRYCRQQTIEVEEPAILDLLRNT